MKTLPKEIRYEIIKYLNMENLQSFKLIDELIRNNLKNKQLK